MKIKQAAEKLQVSPRTIRFYEEKGFIHPVKEGNQYRVFSEADIERLRTIIAFREIGMPLAQIKEILDSMDRQNHDEVSAFLERQRSELTTHWLKIKQMMDTIDQMMMLQKSNDKVGFKELHGLAIELKTLNELRSDWEDRWNFDRQAADYDEQVYQKGCTFDVHANYDDALDSVVKYIAPEKSECGLDIGIGTGNLAARILNQQSGVKMRGTDQSTEMLKRVNQKLPQVETKLGNFLALPFENGGFDFAVTSYALHHLSDDQKLLALEEMDRVLKDNGRIGIADLMFTNENDRCDYLNQLQEAGNDDAVWAIEDEYYANRSRLVSWLEEKGYSVEKKQLNAYLHVIYASKSLN